LKEKTPLSFITIPYVIGIALGYHLSILPKFSFTISIILATATVLVYHNTLFQSHKKETILIIITFISFLFLGVYRISLSPYSKSQLTSTLLRTQMSREITLIIKNIANIERKYSTLECYSIRENENIILYLRNSQTTTNYLVGDTIVLFSKLHPIENFTERFDYKKYKASQRCFSYAFADSSNHVHVKATGTNIRDIFSRLRNRQIKKLRQKFACEEWGDIFIAITTGEKEHLEHTTRKNFQNAGIIHLMAVSGLHTGLIYSYIVILLAFIGNIRYMRIIRLLLALTFTWLYCAYTGFSESSVRAAVMISFMTISKISCGKYQFVNSLYASALITLLLRPHDLMSVGFQLSYISMLSIYYIHPALYSHLVSRNSVKSFFSQLISISLSCQLGTSIITIPQFGYFPFYFLIGNLICSPLAAIVLFLSGIFLFLGVNSGLSYLLIFTIKKAIILMQHTTDTISRMPMVVITTESTLSAITALIITSAITVVILSGKQSNSRGYQ
jgi:competence protein ComEC